MIEIPDQIRTAILSHSSNCAPVESCGLLASDQKGQICFAYPLSNDDRSDTSFTINPEEAYHAFLHADAMGWTISGVFHSHPRGPDALSERDIALAVDPRWIHLLTCPDGLKAYKIRNGIVHELGISFTG